MFKLPMAPHHTFHGGCKVARRGAEALGYVYKAC